MDKDYSYIYKASSMELAFTTVGEQLEEAAKERPNHPFLVSVHQGITKSYRDFNEQVDILAANLLGLGLRKGDRVAIWGRNSYEWLLTEFALAKNGMILVTVCPAYQMDELEYALKHVNCSAIVAQDNMEEIDYYGIIRGVEPEIAKHTSKTLSSNKLPFLKHVIFVSDEPKPGTLDFQDLLKEPNIAMKRLFSDVKANVQPDDPFCIQYTSGTTGRSKAACLSHFQCLNLGRGFGRRIKYDESLILLMHVPMYHALGCVIGIMGILGSKATAVFPSARYNSIASLNAIEKERCTSMLAAPTMLVDMLSKSELKSIDVSSMKMILMGGSMCYPDLVERTEEAFQAKAIIGYGCTESSGVISAMDPDHTEHRLYESVGQPLDLLEVKIVDENENVVPLGHEGQILVRGYNVFLGYWGDEEKTKQCLSSDRWYHTGDLGKLDEEGYVYVVGRQKDMVIRGGENIYPAEVEQFLIKHEAIKDAQVVGVPDHKMGEEVCVWISLKTGMNLTEEDVKNYCKGKITHFKIPRYVFFTDVFPTTVSGKVQKFKLKQYALEKLNLNR